ncbi:MAG: hypothetical protein ACT4NL_07155 [Pseudomarimonas sp.]
MSVVDPDCTEPLWAVAVMRMPAGVKDPLLSPLLPPHAESIAAEINRRRNFKLAFAFIVILRASARLRAIGKQELGIGFTGACQRLGALWV